MDIHAGTSGYSYKEWLGVFYPDKLAAAKMLGFYAGQLPAVEINNTFYRMPKPNVLENWRAQVPESFRFAIKASRRITHNKKLADADGEVEFLTGNLESLGDTFGALLFQLPPFLRKGAERLQKFIDILPDGLPAAFEFRHASWFDDEIGDMLAERNFAWVISENADGETPERISTADWGYLRLRREDYDSAMLRGWHDRIAGQDWSRVFVFFKHEDDGAGPALARRFLDLEQG
ncbi:MAG: DUF72 domain-containing protein [Gammaproteobacteria bacterium]|nr:DUF72 domain-containing protein [Gammaproteobacteria bacterium]